MKALTKFLVARKTETGFQKVAVGSLYSFDGCFAKPDDMSDATHQSILNAARWMFEEPLKPASVDLESGYRISPI